MPRKLDPSQRRRSGPVLEALEARELPSLAPVFWLRPPRIGRPLVIVRPPEPPIPRAGTPGLLTPHERTRQNFAAAFSGSFTTGPGRFTDQLNQTYIRAGGTSTAFLKGNVQIAFFTPVDPSEPITGTATIYPSNTSSTGSLLILDLEGEPGDARDGHPAHLRWTVNDASSGLFALSEGEGSLDLRLRPSQRGPLGARRAT